MRDRGLIDRSTAASVKLYLWSFAAFAFTASLPFGLQSAEKGFDLKVPEIIRAESGTETPIPIEISGEDAAPAQTMVLLHGIPGSVALTEGRLFASGVWAIKVSSAHRVKIRTAPDAKEESEITVSLVTLGGQTLDKVSSRLVITPRGEADGQDLTRQKDVAINMITRSLQPNIAPEKKEKILILMQRGGSKIPGRESLRSPAVLHQSRISGLGGGSAGRW